MAIFGLKIYLLVYNSKSTRRAKLNFGHNADTLNGLCKRSLKAPGIVTKMLHAENGQKVDDFEAMYLAKYQFFRKWFMFFLLTINYLTKVMFVYHILNTIFFLFFLLTFSISYSFPAIYF